MKEQKLKKFESIQELIDHYPYPNQKSDEIGSKHFILPIQNQLKSFNNGLGKIFFFETVKNSKNEIGYLIHSEYVEIPTSREHDKELNYLKVDGFDDCFVGIGQGFGLEDRLIYDKNKMLEKMQKDGMTEEEALDYFEFNIQGCYLADNMPIFLSFCSLLDLEKIQP